jgi:RNA polymerase sigma-70 factor (sigma-E family)
MPTWDAPPAFESFLHSRHRELLRFAHVLTGDAHSAQDLLQESLERVGIGWRRIRQQDDPEGYVRRTMVRRHLNRIRALRRERLTDTPPERVHTDAEPRDAALWRLLGTLPKRQRTVLVLRFYLDQSEAQVAELLGCSVGTVKSNGSRGMAKLRAALGTDSATRTTAVGSRS